MKLEDARRHLDKELARARRALAIERAAPLALPALVALVGWSAVALSGVLDAIPPLAASLLVPGVLAAIVGLVWRALRAYRPPAPKEARARLEADARLDLGSLAVADDRPTRVDPDALALWRREQRRARAQALEARAGGPRMDLRAADPWGMRYVALAALGGGLIFAQLDAPDRLIRGFLPDPGPLLGDRPLQIEAWAAPAAYTGEGPIALSDREGDRIETPPSVEATVRVSGAVGAPKLVFEGVGGRRALDFARADDGAWEAKLAVPGPGSLKVVRFHVKARWTIAPAPDVRPAASFVDSPRIEGGKLRFSWEARDDYGVRAAALELVPSDPPEGLVGAAPWRVPLELAAGAPRRAGGEEELDLAAHPLAGLAVEARLVAADALGQEGRSARGAALLPEPTFLQPTARAAIEARRAILWERRAYAPAPPSPAELFWTPDAVFGARPLTILPQARAEPLVRAPPGVRRAARLLDALTIAPEDGFYPDLAVFAGLAAARATLGWAPDLAGADQAADVLWLTALRAEYGASADARKALEQAQQALADALARGAPRQEIERLTQAMRDAMSAYVDALVAEALREGRQAQSGDDAETQGQLGRQDLDELLKEVERLAQAGRQDEAMALLAQIAGLLDGLEIRLVDGPGGEGGGERPNDPALEEAIEGLSGAMGRQRALRDDTERAERGAPGDADDLASRQDRLAEDLDDARRKLGDGGGDGRRAAERSLDAAQEAMRGAERALRRGGFEEARRRQEEALSALRRGADELAQQQLQDRDRDGPGRAGERGARDPLGRRVGGNGGDGGEVGVPDEIDAERARQIRDELRRRAQDPRRPEIERDYLRRLLERFEGA